MLINRIYIVIKTGVKRSKYAYSDTACYYLRLPHAQARGVWQEKNINHVYNNINSGVTISKVLFSKILAFDEINLMLLNAIWLF